MLATVGGAGAWAPPETNKLHSRACVWPQARGSVERSVARFRDRIPGTHHRGWKLNPCARTRSAEARIVLCEAA